MPSSEATSDAPVPSYASFLERRPPERERERERESDPSLSAIYPKEHAMQRKEIENARKGTGPLSRDIA